MTFDDLSISHRSRIVLKIFDTNLFDNYQNRKFQNYPITNITIDIEL